MVTIRAYLRASTEDQDATRAKQALIDFTKRYDKSVTTYYIENKSGNSLNRPELMRLIEEASNSDGEQILLVEQVDRITRLNANDWETLKASLKKHNIKIVSLDLSTSHTFIDDNATSSDEFSERALAAMNEMILDLLANMAHKDYEDRRRRQAEGIAKRKEADKKKPKENRGYKGRPVDNSKDDAIKAMLKDGQSYNAIIKHFKVGRDRIARLKKEIKNDN